MFEGGIKFETEYNSSVVDGVGVTNRDVVFVYIYVWVFLIVVFRHDRPPRSRPNMMTFPWSLSLWVDELIKLVAPVKELLHSDVIRLI